MRNLLREFIALALNEAAISPQQAAQQGLALRVHHANQYRYVVLYDTKKFAAALEEKHLSSIDGVDFVVGFLKLEKANSSCWNAWEVIASAAYKGYGPMLYDLAMSTSSPIMSDRSSVSQSARGVWQIYEKSRPDVSKQKFDDIDHPQTPPTKDDCMLHHVDALDSAYSINHPIDFSALTRAHEDFIESRPEEPRALNEKIISAGHGLFSEMY